MPGPCCDEIEARAELEFVRLSTENSAAALFGELEESKEGAAVNGDAKANGSPKANGSAKP